MATVRSTRIHKIAGPALAISLLATVAVSAFAWPMARLAPRDVPLGVAGPQAAAAALESRLAESAAFAIHRYAGETAARRALEERDISAAIIVSPERTMLLTASAGAPLVAQLLEQAVAAAAPSPPAVVDVIPADRDDPRGIVLSSLLLPLTLVGTLTGLIVAVVTRPGLVQVGGLVGMALLVGLLAIAIVQGWLGVIGGEWWGNAAVLALLVLAIGSLVAGLTAVLGVGGFVLAAVLLVFVGNPFSGVSTAPALLPESAAFVGQVLPPGAGGSLLRSSAFFDGNGGGGPLTVLLVWAALGLAAVCLGALRPRGGGALSGHPAARLLASPAAAGDGGHAVYNLPRQVT